MGEWIYASSSCSHLRIEHTQAFGSAEMVFDSLDITRQDGFLDGPTELLNLLQLAKEKFCLRKLIRILAVNTEGCGPANGINERLVEESTVGRGFQWVDNIRDRV